MSRFLLVDIGAGTMDVLYIDDVLNCQYKAVVASPVICMAKKIEATQGNLLVTGMEMGGGPVTSALKERAKHHEVVIAASAAATLNHDPRRVESWGMTLVDDIEAEELKKRDAYGHIYLIDLDSHRLENIVDGFGVPFSFDVIGVCAQDHGVPPKGISHLDYRHNRFAEIFDKEPLPHALLYEKGEVPKEMNRLSAIEMSARKMPADEIFIMDSGMAAILGATMDPSARDKQKIAVLDMATSHTVGAALINGEIAGFFEYHTREITPQRLQTLMKEQVEGRLQHDQILSEGGHGAYTRKAFAFEDVEAIIATGPKRGIVSKTTLPIRYGAPMGDNMMTGTAGLFEAICRRKGRF